MGFLADIRATQKAAKQLSAGYDPAQQMRDATARMAGMTRSLQTAKVAAVATVPARAVVLQCGSTGITMNDLPVVALALLVTVAGQPPVPVTVRVPVPLIELATVRPGGELDVYVDPANPGSVRLPWQRSMI